MSNTAGVGSTPGTPLIVQTEPTPVPIGQGVTLVNQGSVTVTLASDPNITPSNSWTLPPNGAAHPVPASTGPLWAVAPVQTTILVIPQVLNLFNPNVLTQNSDTELLNEVDAQTNTGGAAFFILDIPDNIRTLLVSIQSTLNEGVEPNQPKLSCSGLTSQWNYYGEGRFQEPYLLQSSPLSCLVVIPVNPGMDPQVLLDIQFGVSSVVDFNIVVVGDTAQYKEDVFYNGIPQVGADILTGAGNATLLTGPARLLTASLSVQGGAIGAIQFAGQNLLLTGSEAGGPPAILPMPLPPNFIIPYGTTVNLSQSGSGSVAGSISYAYP